MRRLHPILLGCLLVVLSACASPPPSAPQTSSSSPPSAPQTTETTPSPPDPPVAESATDLLDCDGPVSPMGGLAGEFGPDGIGSTHDEAFEAFLETGLFGIPRSGYEKLGMLGSRAVYVYSVEGQVKVVAVISDRFSELAGGAPYTIDELRTCDPSEYGGSVDLGPGRRVWVNEDDGSILTDIAGPGHCGWESARMLHISTPEGTLLKQYVRDPEGVFDGWSLLAEYAEGVELPSDATFSGYRTDDGQELWFTPEDLAAYVVTPEGIERWPRAEEPIGCA